MCHQVVVIDAGDPVIPAVARLTRKLPADRLQITRAKACLDFTGHPRLPQADVAHDRGARWVR